MIQIVTMALLLVAVLAAPAAADKPAAFTDSRTFTDVNPCTNQEHEITLNLEGTVHEHRNNVVVKQHRSGSTDDGSTMIAGTDTFVLNGNGDKVTFVDQWRNPAGYKYMVHGVFKFNANKGELVVANFSIRCIG